MSWSSVPAKVSISSRPAATLIDCSGRSEFADGVQIGEQVRLVPVRQAEAEIAVEIGDCLVHRGVAAVVEIGRAGQQAEQGRRLEQAAAADIVLAVVDEGGVRDVAAGAALSVHLRERALKECGAASFGVAGLR